MRKVISTILAIFTIASPYLFELKAQDNLQVQFESQSTVPDFLNICGDPDNETVRISLNGAVADDITNLTATLNLFKGVQLESFDAVGSSAGVSVDASDPTRPVFTLPTLSTSGTSFVLVSFTISANCEYIDTISANDMALVFDTWDFNYDMGTSTNIQESDANLEYRDAFAVPSFTMGVSDTLRRSRVGDCFTRDILVTNSGLDGFVDTIYYENQQGDGIYVSEILVNGIPITFNKVLDVSGDTLITALIDGTHFANNTIGAGPGDGDAFFDPDETVTITESICVLSCDDSRASDHRITWGCEGRNCTVTSVPDFVRIGEGAANILVVNSGTIPNENTGYCKPGVNSVTFTNDGVEVDTGFAAMIDVAVGVGLGNTFALTDNAYNITGVRIGSVDLVAPQALNLLNGNPLFASDPDGAGIGLEDLDGDGFFDDLGQNQSLEVVVFYEFDCSQAQAPGADGSCPNNFSTIFNARIDHTNQCDERLSRFANSYFSATNTRGQEENFRDTDAFVEEDTFTIIHTQTRHSWHSPTNNYIFKLQIFRIAGIQNGEVIQSFFH